MLGLRPRGQPERLFVGSRRELIADDHALAPVDHVREPGELRTEVADLLGGRQRPARNRA
jgi:hypothetical protein